MDSDSPTLNIASNIATVRFRALGPSAPPTDALSFWLTEETTVVSDTVRIVVRVHAQRALDGTEAALQADIRQAVQSFVDVSDWMLAPARRETQPTGLEVVTLSTSVVVSDAENYRLKERAEKASRPGLTLSNPVADTSVPTVLLQATCSGAQ